MQAVVSIQKVLNIKGEAILIGTVKSGTLGIGMTMSLNGMSLLVKTMEINRQRIEEANEGQDIGFSLSGGDFDTINALTGTDVKFSE